MQHTHEFWVNSTTGQTQVCYREGFKPSGDGWKMVFAGSMFEVNCFASGFRCRSSEYAAMSPESVINNERPSVFFVHKDGHGFVCLDGGNTPTKFNEFDKAVDAAKTRAIQHPGTMYMVVAPVASAIVRLQPPDVYRW